MHSFVAKRDLVVRHGFAPQMWLVEYQDCLGIASHPNVALHEEDVNVAQAKNRHGSRLGREANWPYLSVYSDSGIGAYRDRSEVAGMTLRAILAYEAASGKHW